MTDRTQAAARGTLILVAALALLIGYYWVHKPAGFEMAFTLGGALLDLLAAGAIIAVGGGLGRRALARLLPPGLLSNGEGLALEAAAGLGLLSAAALALGLAGLYTPAALWALLLLAAAALGWPGLRGWLAAARALARSRWPAGAWPRFLAAFTLAALALALLHALAPPVAWDALMYHLDGPRSYLAAGRIVARPDNPYLGFPQSVETLYGLGMALFGRDTAAAPLHFGLGLLALISLGGLARRHGGEAAGWLAPALIMSAYSSWLLFGWPYVDLGVLLYSAAALTAFANWRAARDDRWLILAGASAGLSLGVKYTAGALLLALLAGAAWTAPRRAARIGLLLGPPALILFLPWLGRGLLLYHNPVYPFFFGGLGWDAVRADLFFGGAGLAGRSEFWQVLLLPAAAAIFGVEKAFGFAFTAGPWLLTLPLLVPLGWRWLDAPARALAAACWALLAPL
ncbi:MAG: glycosyltransferase family 39 protein, partial [Aggregatilineales bacterium]